jgi:hypothetical protein
MKTVIFTLLMAVTITGYSQLTANDVGLPQDVYDAYKNVVFTQEYVPGALELTKLETKRTVAGVTTTTKEVVLRPSRNVTPKTTQSGVYGLNLISNFVHEFGYDNIAQHDSGYVFTDTGDGMRFNVWTKNGKYYSQLLWPDYGFRLTDPYTKKSRYYTEAELMTLKYFPSGSKSQRTITRNELAGFSNRYRIGSVVNPQTHVTSLFATIDRISQNEYKGNIYINGNLVTSSATLPLITSYGTTGIRVGAVRWKFLNECVPNDGGQMTTTNVMGSLYYEYGNFGTCDGSSSGVVDNSTLTTTIVSGSSFDYDSTSDIVTYNSSKDMAIWFNFETQIANGKNEGGDGYWSVTDNRRAISLGDL